MLQFPFQILESILEAREQAGSDCAEEERALRHKRSAANHKATKLNTVNA